jgi:Ca-activated chloride channel family protein
MRDLLGRLGPQDLLNVVLFAGSSQILAPAGSLPANAANVQGAIALVDSQGGGGGTEILGALRAAYSIPRAERAVSRTVVVVTDGYVAVEAQAFRFVRERLAEANLFSFGIGAAVNRHLVEGLARAGQGEPFVVLAPDRARAAAQRFREYVERPVLTQIEVRYEGLDVREPLPSQVPDLFAARPIVLVGQYRGAPRGRVVLTGRSGAGAWRATVELGDNAARGEHEPLRILWARRWVDTLQDDLALAPAKELEDAITDIGLSHSLLTRFTSFVAVDSEVVNRGGKPEEVQQPLPLPQGVSDLAVGGRAASLAMGAGTLQRHAGTPAPSPMPDTPRSAETAAKARKDARDSAREQDGHDWQLRVSVISARGHDRTALIRAITARLQSLRVVAGATARLRLTLDSAGRIARVEVLAAADPQLRRALEARLGGFATGLAGAGSAELTVSAEHVRR